MRQLTLKLILLIALAISMSGCKYWPKWHNYATKYDWQVKTHHHPHLQLKTLRSDQKTAFLQVKNSTAINDAPLREEFKNVFGKRGYEVVATPENAYRIVQVHLVNYRSMNQEQVVDALKKADETQFKPPSTVNTPPTTNPTQSSKCASPDHCHLPIAEISSHTRQVLIADVQFSTRKQSVMHHLAKHTSKHTVAMPDLADPQQWNRQQTRIVATAPAGTSSYQLEEQLQHSINHAIEALL